MKPSGSLREKFMSLYPQPNLVNPFVYDMMVPVEPLIHLRAYIGRIARQKLWGQW